MTGDHADVRREMTTNSHGSLARARAFGPHLAANDDGAILDVLPLTRWPGYESSNGFGASKAAL